MRKALVVLLIGALAVSLLPSTALAGDPHAVRNRWTGVAIGAAVATLGGLLLSPLWAPPPVVAAPPVAHTRPRVVYAPPPVVDYRTWIPSHYEDRWVPVTERQRVWVDGHHENGWWVPGHWQEQVRNGGYWTRVWVEGYYR
ncbi:MAG: hypothetical protein HY713_09725 [candidate division NC10 bacterium]|nr:hypothetical protein [candidate division NC10 bacterium]